MSSAVSFCGAFDEETVVSDSPLSFEPELSFEEDLEDSFKGGFGGVGGGSGSCKLFSFFRSLSSIIFQFACV